jgi:hypothetical protein
MRLRQAALLGVLSLVLAAMVTQPTYAAIPGPAAAASTTSAVTIDVRSASNSLTPRGARANAPITQFSWLLNLDNTGDPATGANDIYCHPSTNHPVSPSFPTAGNYGTYVVTTSGYPQGCEWPSIRYAVASPVISEGTQADWNTTKALPTLATGCTYGKNTGCLPDNCPTVANPVNPCRYLVTLSANGYQIGGVHFQVPNATGIVKVFLQPYPIPLGTIRLKVFQDTAPTDGTYEESTEKPIEGFHGIVNDINGIVQADYYGNALCTQYVVFQNTNSGAAGYINSNTDPRLGLVVINRFGKPTPLPAHDPAPRDRNGYYNPTVPGDCLSDSNGDIVIPNMAPNHWVVEVTPPIGAPDEWIQTTTLEGNHDHDVWIMPNDTGYDNELVVGGEPVPFVQFGFVAKKEAPATWTCPAGGSAGTMSGCGRITGQLYGTSLYQPGIYGLPGLTAGALTGMKLQDPIDRGWVSLNSLNSSTGDFDQTVATLPTQDPSRLDVQYPDCPIAPTHANPTTAGWGCFEFSNVPDGEYYLAIWDEPQEAIMDGFNVSISKGQIMSLGVLPLSGWFSHIYGTVCVDTNGNGRCDPGEKGVPQQTVQNLNRTNNSMVGGINTSATDNNGKYDFKEAYPLGLMSINQYFVNRWKTSGVTFQACNDPQEHTVIGPMVDVSYLPQLGQCGRLDWAVVPYSPSSTGDNGGIVATQIYDEIRQKYNARQAQTMDYQTGIPGFTTEQYTPVKGAGPGGTDPLSGYALNSNGSYCTVEGAKSNPVFPTCGDFTAPVLTYITENNGAPAQCFPMDANGKPLGYVAGQPNSFDFLVSGGACIESAVSATQIGLGTDGQHAVQTVDGNYGIGNPYDIPAANLGDTVIKQVSPVDLVLPNDPSTGQPRPLYTATTEEDVNMFSSAQYIPQGAYANNLPWPAAIPDANQMPNDLAKPDGGTDENPYTTGPGPDPICAGPTHTVQANTITGTGTVGAATLTDATKSWGENQLIGRTVTRGASSLFVTSNTATVLTGAGGWSPAAPASGRYSISINPDLMANGGNPMEGTVRHLCDTKLLTVHSGQSIAPNFHVHTVVDIPLPAHFWGYIVDDVSVESNLKSTNLGGVHGLPGVPVGVYDWSGRRVYTANSDYNGVWELLMPSADIFNCPTPAQTCPNVYRFVGNDPGQPSGPNLNYNPNYRTISATFEAWPNMLIPADTAPTRATTGLLAPGLQYSAAAPCGVKDAEPQLLSIGPNPFVNVNTTPLTITGLNFGLAQGSGSVQYTPDVAGSTPVTLQVTSWSDRSITVNVGRGTGAGMPHMPVGSGALSVTNGSGLTTTNGVAFHVLGTASGRSYNPHLVVVGPGRRTGVAINGYPVDFGVDPFQLNASGNLVHPFAIQEGLDYAASHWRTNGQNSRNPNDANNQWLVVVYPHYDAANPANPLNEVAFVPQGTYFENVIIHSPLQLQGVGPGGINPDGTVVQGSVIDGRFWSSVAAGQFDAAAAPGLAPSPTEPNLLHWVNLFDSLRTTGTGFTANAALPWTGDQAPGDGAVVTVLGTIGTYPNLPTNNFRTGVNGFTISGGDQGGFPANLSELTGTPVSPGLLEGGAAEGAGAISTQGGAVFVIGGTDRYKLTDNLMKQNSGTYGAVRFGSEYQGVASLTGGASHNYDISISHNLFVADGGTNLAGALGIFDDTKRYSVDHNIFCMNLSAEYGGAISHFGLSDGGKIQYNRIFLNTAFDEGGAITIASNPGFRVVAGAVVVDPNIFTQGTGGVSIDHNYISDNLAQDDGGAMRIMGTAGTAGLSPITISDNVIANNVSLHEGGAISLHDVPLVDIVNNSITQNVTTATAVTSNGLPSPAGISVDMNSAGLNALLLTKPVPASSRWMGGSWKSFSNARIENDILWYNRAGSWAEAAGVAGIGMPGDTSTINFWDVGSNDSAAVLTVTHSLVGSAPNAPTQQYNDGGGNLCPAGCGGVITAPPATGGLCSNVLTDANSCAIAAYNGPQFTNPYATVLSIIQMRTYFRFRPAAIITAELPPDVFNRMNYWIVGGSPAQNLGIGRGSNPEVPATDIENNSRPSDLVDAGAYQVVSGR